MRELVARIEPNNCAVRAVKERFELDGERGDVWPVSPEADAQDIPELIDHQIKLTF
jgi:hypothetical protein